MENRLDDLTVGARQHLAKNRRGNLHVDNVTVTQPTPTPIQ
jgi:hypothetical protein